MSKFYTKISAAVLVLLLVLPLMAYAQEQKKADDKKGGPIQIEADSMKYYGEKQMSHFSGNVVVIRDGMKMTSDEMDVYFTPEKEVKEIFSRGNVKIEKQDLLALSGEARIYQQEQKIVLTKNARVWQGDNYLEGEKVTLYNDTDKLFVDKGPDKRVKIIITPQKEKQ